jgi:hypothetical protein
MKTIEIINKPYVFLPYPRNFLKKLVVRCNF